MKALSLPVNMVVIIVIAVAVLLSISAFFLGGFGMSKGTISDTDALNIGCAKWRALGGKRKPNPNIIIPDIKINGYDKDADGDEDVDLRDACINVLNSGDFDNNMLELGKRCQTYCCGYSEAP